MRCKAGRTRGPADEDFELSRFYHLKQGAAGGGGEDECRMVNIQPVLAVDFSSVCRVSFGVFFGEIAHWKKSTMVVAK